MTLRTHPILALLIAIFILFALSGAVYALGRALGYIPGVGLVDQSAAVQVLAEPITVEEQGISVTVSKVVADSTRTFISYHVEGIPFVENSIPACITPPELHLPDGSILENRTPSGGTGVRRNGDSMSYGAEGVYAAIPNRGNAVTFILSCALQQEGGPDKVELPLTLVPAPKGYATPAVEIAVTPNGDENKTGLHLEKVVELTDSYVLIGKFTDAGNLNGPLYMTTSSDSDYLPHIEDANGKPVTFKVREDLRPDPDWDVAYYWAYEIPKSVITPLTVTVDQVKTRKHNTAQIQFNAGDHPQAGQIWDINETVKLGASEFVLDSITFLGNGYQFNLSSENLPEGVTPDIEIVERSSLAFQFDNIDSTVDNSKSKGVYMIKLITQSMPPTGNLSVNWGLEEYLPQPGPWSLVWTPSSSTP